MKIYCIVFGCLLVIMLIGFLLVFLSSGDSVECLCEKLRVYKPKCPSCQRVRTFRREALAQQPEFIELHQVNISRHSHLLSLMACMPK